MSLLFDLCAIQPSQGKFHGGGEYARAVLNELLKKRNYNFSCVYLKNEWIDENLLNQLKSKKITLVEIYAKSEIPTVLENGNYKTFYSAMPYDYSEMDFNNIMFIFTIHGLRDLEMPTDIFEYKYGTKPLVFVKYLVKSFFPKWYNNYIKKKFQKLLSFSNKKILVPSLHTKYSLVTQFDLNPSAIQVFYSPLKVGAKPIIAEKDREQLETVKNLENFILLIGGNRWIKNCYRALESLKFYITENVEVVITGGTNLQKYYSDCSNFHFLDYVENSTLEYLYKKCSFLLYPTLNEGFGYPPLEVMKYGKPVIASAVTSITEIYGDSLLYINPFSGEEIATRVNQLLLDESTYIEYSEKSKRKFLEITLIQKKMLRNLVSTIIR
jgi:glycosyltransferase involved in cell wall biosynthesis